MWIDVKDRLPTMDNNNKYIVVLINNTPMLCEVHDCTLSLKDKLSFHWPSRTWIKKDFYAEISHWMPLPDLPKENENVDS